MDRVLVFIPYIKTGGPTQNVLIKRLLIVYKVGHSTNAINTNTLGLFAINISTISVYRILGNINKLKNVKYFIDNGHDNVIR